MRCGSCAWAAWLPSSRAGCSKRRPSVAPDRLHLDPRHRRARRVEADRLLERRTKHAEFRDSDKTLDTFDFDFNKKMNRRLIYELAGGQFIDRSTRTRSSSGRPAPARAISRRPSAAAAIQQGVRVLYREAHVLVEEIADADLDGTRKECLADLATVPLLIIDDLGMRKLPPTAAEDLLELVMRRYERASTLFTSNRPVEDWGKLFGDTAAVAAMLDRLLHHGHVLKCGPRSWRTKTARELATERTLRAR